MKLLSRVRFFATPWTVALQAPPSMGSPGKNTRVGCHFLLQYSGKAVFNLEAAELGVTEVKLLLSKLQLSSKLSMYFPLPAHLMCFVEV